MLRSATVKLRRAIVIYVGTIVIPVCGLVWLGLQSFERQREALTRLIAEKVAAEVQRRERAAAQTALQQGKGPVAKHFFRIERGKIVRPALTAPLPKPLPREFLEADRLESAGQTEAALEVYRKLIGAGERSGLAQSRAARCLEKLGRHEEARAVWKKLAAAHPDERDLAHRPYGIVAAIAAGDTSGLADQIAAGRWELAADQAEYFLAELDAVQQSAAYVDRFRFARALEEAFRPAGVAREGELHPYSLGDYRLYYRAVGPEQVDGLAVDTEWVEGALRPQAERDLGATEEARREVLVYGGAIALVLLVLSAGIALLLREVGRETRTNRLRADFVSGVSHELKTPITLIRLYGDTLLERPGLGASERNDFYRIIVRESERLTRLVNQVLTFSRVERGAERYNLEVGDLAPPILRLMDDYSEYIERAGFTLRRELAESTPPVRFDATAVLQAVSNLLDNAVKYSGESRGITARLGSQDGTVVFEVEDRGCGIPEVERHKIFDRFYRVANGSGKGGYGLGLFLVRHIMQAHGGRVEVESEPGRGSTFRLVFPAVTPSVVQA
jgi:signal transduction histidine kinase